MSYVDPEWAQKPSTEWSLTEIKGGTEVEKHNLHLRATTIFGRALDMVHIPVNHESASRQHARISFDSQGIPWLRDLKSTHGTFCNKRRLPPEVCGKIESNSNKAGSRGIMVYPGDVLKFGASTRTYFLEGPPDFERGAMKAKMQQAMNSGNRPLRPTQENQTEVMPEDTRKTDRVSWGISMEDEDDEEEGTTATNKSLPLDIQVPDKHRKAFDRLNARKYKLSNMETEDGKIRRKGDLSQGQEKQLQRNAEREEALKRSIVELEEELYDKLYPEKSGNKRRTSNSHQDVGEDEDDDFFDRTKVDKEDVIDSEESETTLVAKWKKIYEQKSHQESSRLPAARKTVSLLQQRLSTLEASGDEEAFFVKNDLALSKESLDKILAEQQTANSNMDEIEKLLKIVNPKIHTNRDSGFIGEGAPPGKEKEAVTIVSLGTMLPPPARPKSPPKKIVVESKSDHFSMPPPMIPPPIIQRPTGASRKSNHEPNDNLMPPPMPPPKRLRVAGPSMPPPQPSSAVPKPSSTRQNSAKQQGTLAFLSSMTKSTKKSSDDSKEPTKVKDAKKTAMDPKKDVWRAPAGQDGSGITKLNAKFAGRY
jgi:pSer/pThr/pTyr-binding forkhead associated (FHA) protein